ncbi:hypothetical protein LCGC14_2017110, partial [marine sediment metagenome]
VGKTTCKELIAAVLGARWRVLKSDANLNTEIGLPLTLLQLAPEHERAVLEMAMYGPREIDLLCRIAQPHIGVVTNVGPVHLERLGSMGAIIAAKAEKEKPKRKRKRKRASKKKAGKKTKSSKSAPAGAPTE